MLPRHIYGKDVSDDEVKKYWSLRRQSYLTKYTSWSYENEIRIVVDDWFYVKSSADKVIKKTVAERVFYYDQRQLNGIVFGTHMNKSECEEIRVIIYNLRRKLLDRDNVFFNGYQSGAYLPIFIFYKAKESVSHFRMEIEALDGLDATNSFFSIEKLDVKKQELNNLVEHYQRQDDYRRKKQLLGPVGVNGTILIKGN